MEVLMTSVDAWKVFFNSGKVIDYLNYVKIKRKEQNINL
jgi:hypothetical protein